MNMFNKIDEKHLSDRLISLRRDFHRYPEAGWTEYRTTVKIIEELQALGVDVLFGPDIHSEENMPGKPSPDVDKKCIERAIQETDREDLISIMAGGYTGVVGIIEGANPGPTIALRFDIDCNDVVESKDSDHYPFKEGFSSIHNGLMHACGHDGHAAIGIGTAEILTKYRDELRGKIILIFQAAEEGGRGANSYVNSGMLKDVDYILGGHIGLRADKSGLVTASATGFMASTKFDVEYIGKSAHAGANPELGNNALAAAATASLNLLAIARHSQGSSRLNIGILEAGSGRNVIPDTASMKIETRGLNENINTYMYDRAIKICTHAAMMYDCEYKFNHMGGTTSAECDPELVDFVMDSLSNIPEIKKIKKSIDFGAGEDFTYMMKEVQDNGGKATFLMLGSELADAHHSRSFDFDEDVLIVGAKSFARIAMDLSNHIK